jgi:putative DNA primase/helicase
MRADTSRITSLELKKLGGEAADSQFVALKQLWAETMADPAYAQGIRARSLHLAKVICANGKVFGAAVASKLGDQRIGDQLGALLAGAYSLTSTKPVDLDFAKQWVEAQNWNSVEVSAAVSETA